jgi:hypothetical protein
LITKASIVTLTSLLALALSALVDAEGFQLGDVGLVIVGDVGDDHPVAVQVGARDLLDARQFLALDSAELGEVDLGPGQHFQTADVAAGRLGSHSLLSQGLHGAGHHRLGEGLDVFRRDAALVARALDFCQRHAQFASELAHRRRRGS